MNLINKAIAAAENDELASDWRKEPAQYAPVIRELVARVAELERQCLHQIQEPESNAARIGRESMREFFEAKAKQGEPKQ